ncbi:MULTISPECIES: CPBP family intramembrane glutamic endopeptidase [Sphingobacterium]|uniref:CPBP family intramembrane glutamic endopeptidase n=1 Tax=Sphingobacterium TaxID=28453 RepID=UPI0013E4B478|nr:MULTISPECIES: CPBP family intramembrane glutamic endopeptidase [Sphingobacterium]QIH34644.1 CPBP family intramembrane metalloprotease [Sphingobacterium sp. DR205]
MKRKINFGAIVTYYIIAIVCRYFTNKTELLSSFESPYLKSILTGVGPAIGATAVFLIFNIKPVLSLKGNYKNMLIPMALYWVFPIALISMVSYVTLGKIPYLAISSVLIYGLLEEIGWRGFLYQEFKALKPLYNILLLSVLWFLWHLNFDFTPIQISFFVILVLGSWGIGKVADSTGSLIAVSAFHSLNNFFPTMNTKSGAILGILLIVWIVNLVLRKRKMERG